MIMWVPGTRVQALRLLTCRLRLSHLLRMNHVTVLRGRTGR